MTRASSSADGRPAARFVSAVSIASKSAPYPRVVWPRADPFFAMRGEDTRPADAGSKDGWRGTAAVRQWIRRAPSAAACWNCVGQRSACYTDRCARRTAPGTVAIADVVSWAAE